jgi:hypothetical protein
MAPIGLYVGTDRHSFDVIFSSLIPSLRLLVDAAQTFIGTPTIYIVAQRQLRVYTPSDSCPSAWSRQPYTAQADAAESATMMRFLDIIADEKRPPTAAAVGAVADAAERLDEALAATPGAQPAMLTPETDYSVDNMDPDALLALALEHRRSTVPILTESGVALSKAMLEAGSANSSLAGFLQTGMYGFALTSTTSTKSRGSMMMDFM